LDLFPPPPFLHRDGPSRDHGSRTDESNGSRELARRHAKSTARSRPSRRLPNRPLNSGLDRHADRSRRTSTSVTSRRRASTAAAGTETGIDLFAQNRASRDGPSRCRKGGGEKGRGAGTLSLAVDHHASSSRAPHAPNS